MDQEVQELRRTILKELQGGGQPGDLCELIIPYTHLLQRFNLFDCDLKVHREHVEMENNRSIGYYDAFKRAQPISCCRSCELAPGYEEREKRVMAALKEIQEGKP